MTVQVVSSPPSKVKVIGGTAGAPAQPRYNGPGPPPDVIVGSVPGDEYLDTQTGDIYRQQ